MSGYNVHEANPPPSTTQAESYMNMITTQIQSFKALLYIHIISILYLPYMYDFIDFYPWTPYAAHRLQLSTRLIYSLT